MEDLPKIIVAGKPQFTEAVAAAVANMKAAAHEVHTVTATSMVTDALLKKRNYYTHLFLEDTFYKYHCEDHIEYSRELCPLLKVILCRSKPAPVKSKADAVITGTINREKIEAVINSRKHADSEKKILLALKEGYTVRQLQVFNGVAEGLSNTEIAERYFVSKRTIDTHREKLNEKAGAKNPIQLMFFGYRKKWADDYGKSLLDDEILKRLWEKNPKED